MSSPSEYLREWNGIVGSKVREETEVMVVSTGEPLAVPSVT